MGDAAEDRRCRPRGLGVRAPVEVLRAPPVRGAHRDRAQPARARPGAARLAGQGRRPARVRCGRPSGGVRLLRPSPARDPGLGDVEGHARHPPIHRALSRRGRPGRSRRAAAPGPSARSRGGRVARPAAVVGPVRLRGGRLQAARAPADTRVAIHPPDMVSAICRRSIERVLARLVPRTRQRSYGEFVRGAAATAAAASQSSSTPASYSR